MTLTDLLKSLYGDKESMSLAEISQAASAAKGPKFVDLADGGYVDEGKYANVSAKLTTANQTIQTLRQAVQNFEGVDVQQLRDDLAAEKAARVKDRQTWQLQAALKEAGCKDPDYVLYKLGNGVEFAEDGSLKDKEGLLATCKQDYAAMFDAPEQPTGTGGLGNFARRHDSDKPLTREDFQKLPYMEKYKIKTERPEEYKALVSAQSEKPKGDS